MPAGRPRKRRVPSLPDKEPTVANEMTGPRRRAVPRRRWIAVAVAVGALIGAYVGVQVAARTSAERSATLLDLSPALITSGGPPPAQDADRAIQSELLYLNSSGFARSVARAAGNPAGSSFSAAQVGATDVLRLVAVAPKGPQAQAMATAAVPLYAAHRKAALNGQITGLQPQLAAAQKDLADAQAQANAQAQAAAVANAQAATQAALVGASPPPLVTPTNDLTVFQNRVNALRSQVDSVQATLNSPAVGGTVVQSAHDAGASRTMSPTIAGGAGLAVGALLGLVLAAVPLPGSRRVWTEEDGPDLGVSVLQPPLPVARPDWLQDLPARRSDDPVEAAARLLAARVAGSLAEGRPLVLVGAGPGVGTSFTAVNLATALARRRRTVLVPLGDVADGQVAGWFGATPDGAGLLDAARASSVEKVEGALLTTSVQQLYLLTVARDGRWEPVEEALAGQALPQLLASGWTVVVDCPPADLSTASFELRSLRPVTGVVTALGRTASDRLSRTVEQLPKDEKAELAIVLNRMPRRGPFRPPGKGKA
jgi:Mrp family chromosome partitioning ATPase